MSEELVFDAEPIEIPVTIGDKNYLLCEADGATTEAYNDMQMQGAVFSGGKTSVNLAGLGSIESFLVSKCLWLIENDVRKPVSQDTVKSWRGRIQKTLHTRAKEISDIDQPTTKEEIQDQIDKLQERLAKFDEGAVKNEPEGTTDGTNS